MHYPTNDRNTVTQLELWVLTYAFLIQKYAPFRSTCWVWKLHIAVSPHIHCPYLHTSTIQIFIYPDLHISRSSTCPNLHRSRSAHIQISTYPDLHIHPLSRIFTYPDLLISRSPHIHYPDLHISTIQILTISHIQFSPHIQIFTYPDLNISRFPHIQIRSPYIHYPDLHIYIQIFTYPDLHTSTFLIITWSRSLLFSTSSHILISILSVFWTVTYSDRQQLIHALNDFAVVQLKMESFFNASSITFWHRHRLLDYLQCYVLGSDVCPRVDFQTSGDTYNKIYHQHSAGLIAFSYSPMSNWRGFWRKSCRSILTNSDFCN